MLVVAVIFILLGLALYALSRTTTSTVRLGEQTQTSSDQLVKVRDALVSFVSINGYLPCPADGSLSIGTANPVGASATCNTPKGVVPWTTLGLSSNDVSDAFQSRISYRVFSGLTGLTQAGGANMANCDSLRAATPVPPTAGADAITQLCRTDHDTSPEQFLAGKGFTINDAGTAVSGVAFVLISHGPNQAGAYLSSGTQKALPNTLSAEYGHTQATGPFTIKAADSAQVTSSDPAYFDDSLTYLTITDLVGRAKTTARDWPDPAPVASSGTYSVATVSAAAVAAGATPVNQTTNISTLTIGGVQITSTGTGGREIAMRTGSSGEGIGLISTSSTSAGAAITTSGGETLTFNFPAPGQQLGIMLVDFGSAGGQFEQARIVVKNGATTLLTATLVGCRTGAQLASYSINVGSDFDTIQVSALNRVGSSNSSSFLIGGLNLCLAGGDCRAPNATPATACAYP